MEEQTPRSSSSPPPSTQPGSRFRGTRRTIPWLSLRTDEPVVILDGELEDLSEEGDFLEVKDVDSESEQPVEADPSVEDQLARVVLLEQIEVLKAQVDQLSGERLTSVCLCVIDAVGASTLDRAGTGKK